MNVLKRAGSPFAALADKAREFVGEKIHESGLGVYELAGVDVLGKRPSLGGYKADGAASSFSGMLDLGSILRLRSFLYLVAATGVFLFQISSTLAINDLALRNERLREKLRISASVTTAQALELRQLQSIRNITGPAQQLGLDASPVPPVELKP